MKIVFRVDSSVDIGSGHYMRCLALASRLKKKAEIFFVSRNLNGSLNSLAKKYGKLIELPKTQCKQELSAYERWLTVTSEIDAAQTKEVISYLSADCLIVDHYALGESWEKIMRPYVKKIMVIDDLANRKHDCDILLDQGHHQNILQRYEGLVPLDCKLLLGIKYLLLRREFYHAKTHKKIRDGHVKNILVFFGGSDSTNETLKTLQALKIMSCEDIIIQVVVGYANPNKIEIKKMCDKNKNMRYFCQVDYMADLMNQADLSIGAGGTAVWERIYLELPSLVIYVAENQRVNSIGDMPYIELGWYEDVSIEDIISTMRKVLDDTVILKRLSEKCREFANLNNNWGKECEKWMRIL